MKSVTDAFEDADIAREELPDREKLFGLLRDNYFFADTDPPIFEVADAILAAGFSRQSPASTTAADAWIEGAEFVNPRIKYLRDTYNTHNPYRVAAPEGDGGNE